jgi:hypothetical protein
MSQPQTKEMIEAQFAELQALREENAKLKNKRTVDNMKVSTKGAISFYGLGRFPVTLYASQWEKLILAAKEGRIEDFIRTNAHNLAKDQRKVGTEEEVLNQQ